MRVTDLLVDLFFIALVFIFGMVSGFSVGLGDPVTLEQMYEEKKLLPTPPKPVMIRVVDLDEDGLYGACDIENEGQMNEYYLILIDDDCSAELASFILIHEWAHTLSWEDEVRDGDHSAAWGEAYSRCYLAMFPEN